VNAALGHPGRYPNDRPGLLRWSPVEGGHPGVPQSGRTPAPQNGLRPYRFWQVSIELTVEENFAQGQIQTRCFDPIEPASGWLGNK